MRRIDSRGSGKGNASSDAAHERDECESEEPQELETAEIDYASLDAVPLMKLAQMGDPEAYDELGRLAVSEGNPPDHYVRSWSENRLEFALMDRVSGTSLLARGSVKFDLAKAFEELSLPSDGAIERIVVGKIAVALVESRNATIEHLKIVAGKYAPDMMDHYEQRRNRADRRLYAALKALSEIRRLNKTAIQVNLGNGNTNILTA